MREFKVDVNETDFNIIAYTARALKSVGLGRLIPEMHREATSGGHYYLMAVCDDYIFRANEVLREEGGI